MPRFADEDEPQTTDFFVEDGAEGITEEAAIVVFSSVENAKVDMKPGTTLVFLAIGSTGNSSWADILRKQKVDAMWSSQRGEHGRGFR